MYVHGLFFVSDVDAVDFHKMNMEAIYSRESFVAGSEFRQRSLFHFYLPRRVSDSARGYSGV
jgi:hypothetical protein